MRFSVSFNILQFIAEKYIFIYKFAIDLGKKVESANTNHLFSFVISNIIYTLRMGKRLRDRRGFSLAGAAVASATFAVLAGVVGTMVGKQAEQFSKRRVVQTCRDAVNYVIEDFKLGNSRTEIYNNLVDPVTVPRPSGMDSKAVIPRIAVTLINSGDFYNWQNIENGVTRLFQAYHSNSSICSTGIDLLSGNNINLLKNSSGVNGFSGTITIQAIPVKSADGANFAVYAFFNFC